jgi:hypothetical protein
MTPSESKAFVEWVRNRLYPDKVNQPIGQPAGFEVVKHVAWALRDRGWGLVAAKPGSHNNVAGYTGDVIAKPDGFHSDVLVDGEGAAFATWQPHDDPGEMAAIKPRVRPALEMPPLSDAPPPPPPPPPVDTVGPRLDQLQRDVDALRAELQLRPLFARDEAHQLVVDILTNHLEVVVDVQPAGPDLSFLGRRYNLRHDHEVAVVLKLFGQEVRRVARHAQLEPTITEEA